jgi:phosphoribosylanthranilate isomerase
VAPDVKFCGLTRLTDAEAAAALGAAYLGVIFAGGPRAVDVAAARLVLGKLGGHARRVGVFGAAAPEEILAVASDVPLDVVQLHGDPDAGYVDAVRRLWGGDVWAVLRIGPGGLSAASASLFRAADAVVLDAKVSGRLGGTGVALDWLALRAPIERIRGETPLVLAGGLTPVNVSEAIGALVPSAVDVSSGVESAPGIKDPARMRAFADAVRLCGAAR